MNLDTVLSSSDFLNFIIYDTISASNNNNVLLHTSSRASLKAQQSQIKIQRKKRKRRKARAKNKEEAESQRMTHITVERNRRKQMNDHLSVLKSLMPHSYVQRVSFLLSLINYPFSF